MFKLSDIFNFGIMNNASQKEEEDHFFKSDADFRRWRIKRKKRRKMAKSSRRINRHFCR